MGSFPTGVAVVAARTTGGQPCGLTVNSLTSVSLRPLLLLACLDQSSETREAVLDSAAFAVNILRAGAEFVSDSFSCGGREHRFKTVPWREEVTGSPVFEDALAWIDCQVEQAHSAGDHVIVVGRVRACGLHGGAPLVYLQGGYRRLMEPEPLG
ncbi:MAG: flavin reductase family protein [Gemmatimonadaceae bacterium]